jgi:hypothetical protein
VLKFIATSFRIETLFCNGQIWSTDRADHVSLPEEAASLETDVALYKNVLLLTKNNPPATLKAEAHACSEACLRLKLEALCLMLDA